MLNRLTRVAVPQAMVAMRASQRFAHAAATTPAVQAAIPLTFVSMTGQRFPITGLEGETLLQAAKRHGLPIPGTCNGGGLGRDRFGEGPMCRNCHVYVDNAHVSTLPPKGQDEIDLTEWIQNKNANSRFACEIIVDDSIKNMTIVIPEYPDRP